MEDDSSTATARARRLRHLLVLAAWVAVILMLSNLLGSTDREEPLVPLLLQEATAPAPPVPAGPPPWTQILTPEKLVASTILLVLSAFFSASEIAFFSLHRLRLRSMGVSQNPMERLAAHLMEHPGNLLASILMGNSIVNVLISVVLAAPVEELIASRLQAPAALSYALAVIAVTGFLVLFGEILPKVAVVRMSESYVRLVAVPVLILDRLLMPMRDGVLLFIGFFFRITRFSRVRPAPFITDAEFKSLLSESEASGVIEKGEREMIQGILEFSEVTVREILIPRPDMIAIKESATVGEALQLFRTDGYSRMPTYSENLDHITGLLYAKDLLPAAEQGELEQTVKALARRVYFVPETMTVSLFIKTVQRLRTHLAIVVDEYGGTEGLVTLQDALREVIGDFGDEDEEEHLVTKVERNVFLVDGSLPLHELEELTGLPVDDSEHATVAGFVLDLIEKIPEEGDRVEHLGVLYQVEQVEGKRISKLLIKTMEAQTESVES
ncbi:MAG: HlyC/CorC family transporter [Candidatus Hydrogenedentes bacterium]|nr:HlyC/CorC family transporter [Candidatus Hydrogenedentota bacterium]